jgi:uncharacterized protein YaiE (UPF0345 family)
MSDQVIKAPDPVDWSAYEDGGSGKPLPPAGEYQLEVVEVQTKGQDGKPLRSKAGYLQPIIDVKVIAPGQPYNEFLSRFNRFNTQKWKNRNGNPLADYLRGFGLPGPFTTDDEYMNAAQATKGRRLTATLDWEIYDSASGFSLKGMDSFPTDANGNRVSKVKNGGTEHFANVRIKFVKSIVKKQG